MTFLRRHLTKEELDISVKNEGIQKNHQGNFKVKPEVNYTKSKLGQKPRLERVSSGLKVLF
jgi:predicted transcriptional regulator